MQVSDAASYNGATADTFTQTQAGSELNDAINAAKAYFRDNPDWLGALLEVTPPPDQRNKGSKEKVNGAEEKDVEKSKGTEEEGEESVESTTPVKTAGKFSAEEDVKYRERREKRMKDVDMFSGVQRNKKDTGEDAPADIRNGSRHNGLPRRPLRGDGEGRIQPPPPSGGRSQKLLRTQSNPHDGDVMRSQLGMNSPDLNQTRTLPSDPSRRRNSAHVIRGTQSLKTLGEEYSSDDSILANGNDEDLQLQRDIEFIRNRRSDAQRRVAPPHDLVSPIPLLPVIPKHLPGQGQSQSVLDIDLSGYTPPEEFLTLSNGCLQQENDDTGVVMEIGCEDGSNQDTNVSFHNPLVDTNANKLTSATAVPNHFVIDFVDPSVKQKPDQLDFNFSTA